MQLLEPFKAKCFNDEIFLIENLKHLEIFRPSQYRSVLINRVYGANVDLHYL
jgi:hypothetical protein